MKKFLIFLVAIVVVVSFGLTIFYFVRNDEVINFTTKEIYCNVGDVVKLDELGLTVKKRNKKTTYNYNAGGEEVTNKVEYDTEHNQYVVKTEVGGDVTLTITTSNKKCPKFEIVLHIGDGNANPYNILNENQLKKINDGYDADANYVLRNDIVLTSNFQPIGYFSGYFNGNNHTISGLNLATTDGLASAGLFQKVDGATIVDLGLENISIVGEFNYAGALAGEIVNSTISCVAVKGANINAGSGTAGALAGVIVDNKGGIITDNGNKIDTVSCYADNAIVTGKIAGGLVGKLDRGMLRATYAIATVNEGEGATDAKLGGLVGQFVIDSGAGSIQQSYAVSTSANSGFGSFIGSVEKVSDFSIPKGKNNAYLVGNYCVGVAGQEIAQDSTDYFGTLFTEDEDYKIVNKTTRKELEQVNDYVFFSIEQEPTLWDSNAWQTTSGQLPALRMVKDVQGVTAEFINSTEKTIIGKKSVDKSDPNGANGQELADYLQNPQEKGSVSLLGGYTYKMNSATVFTPKDIKDIVISGEGAIIDGLTVDGCLFSKIDNCTIKDLTFTNLTIKNTAKGLFGEVFSTNKYTTSSISNVKVSYKPGQEAYITTVDSVFGGLVANVKNNTTIESVNVSGLTVDANSTTAYVGGVVGLLESGSLNNATVSNVELAGAKYLAGAVAENNGTIKNFEVIGDTAILANNAEFVGGLVADNSGTIDGAKSLTYIQVSASTVDGAHIGGLVADNNGKVVDSEFAGNGIILVEDVSLTNLYVGGVAAYNYGKVENVKVTAEKIDLYNIDEDTTTAGKNYYVGGVASVDAGTISKAVVNADLAGNYVAGVVVDANGSIDQVYVGKTDVRNTIVGDKFVAGVAYDVTNVGTVSNVQTYSTVQGTANGTVSSLVVLFFPDGATFKNGVINNAAEGFGKLYTETWTDYATPNSFNLYGEVTSAGSFTSVVINNTHIAETLSVKSSFFSWTLNWFQFNTGYNFSGNTNFFRYAGDEDFTKSSTFTGNYTLVADGNNSQGWKFWWNDEFTYDWTFGSEWTIENGIQLAFLNPVQE